MLNLFCHHFLDGNIILIFISVHYYKYLINIYFLVIFIYLIMCLILFIILFNLFKYSLIDLSNLFMISILFIISDFLFIF